MFNLTSLYQLSYFPSPPKLLNMLQSPSLHHHHLGFRSTLSYTQNSFPSLSFSSFRNPRSRRLFLVAQVQKRFRNTRPKGELKIKGKKKDNVWSVDNELAKAASENEKGRANRSRQKGRRRMVKRKTSKGGKVMVSGAMLMEVDTVLQTQEPVIKPAWNTFASSVSGIWIGVGAVFSPLSAEMEPVEIGNRNENLYDCYTLSRIEAVPSPSGGRTSQIQRKINWVTLNPFGEAPQYTEGTGIAKDGSKDSSAPVLMKEKIIDNVKNNILPTFESFDFKRSDVMEEDVMECEPGLVYFEDGSYSRGPIDIPLGEFDDTEYYVTPTYKFEQCLVKSCHKRIRIVHTIEFINGGSDIQIMRVAVYEEQWASPSNLYDPSDLEELDVKLFSQRKRTKPSELIGSWKVFEVSATPVFGEEDMLEEGNSNGGTPYVYLCTENLKKRSFPESTNSFREEEMVDMQDVTMLWLPGGVTCYVDISKDGILCIGVGWYSDEGINLVMERDYGVDGKLKEVRWKSEVKRRWSNPPTV